MAWPAAWAGDTCRPTIARGAAIVGRQLPPHRGGSTRARVTLKKYVKHRQGQGREDYVHIAQEVARSGVSGAVVLRG